MKKILGILMIAIACLALNPSKVSAQEDYRFDIGGGVGMTGYLGDANPSNLLKYPSWNAEAFRISVCKQPDSPYDCYSTLCYAVSYLKYNGCKSNWDIQSLLL